MIGVKVIVALALFASLSAAQEAMLVRGVIDACNQTDTAERYFPFPRQRAHMCFAAL